MKLICFLVANTYITGVMERITPWTTCIWTNSTTNTCFIVFMAKLYNHDLKIKHKKNKIQSNEEQNIAGF